MSVRRRTVLVAAAAFLAAGTSVLAPGLTSASTPVAGGEDVSISFLTHWPPETVALLEAAAATYSQDQSRTSRSPSAPCPFGDLLTTLRSQAAAPTARRSPASTISGCRSWCATSSWRRRPTRLSADVKSQLAGRRRIGGDRRRHALRHPQRDRRLRAELQQGAVRGGRHRRPAQDLGRVRCRRREADREGSHGQQGFGMINSWAAGVVHPFASLLASNGGDLVVDGKPALDSKQAERDLRSSMRT